MRIVLTVDAAEGSSKEEETAYKGGSSLHYNNLTMMSSSCDTERGNQSISKGKDNQSHQGKSQ